MKINDDRLYPYPVLSPMYDDYVNNKFEINVQANKKNKKTILNIDYSIDNKEFNEMIVNKKISIFCHFECPKTKLRYIKELSVEKNNFEEISNSKLDEELQIVAFAVANEDINDFFSQDFNKDYENNKFKLECGTILGISNQKEIQITKDLYDLSKVPSIISIAPYVEEVQGENKIKINLDKDKITVLLAKSEYDKYVALKSNQKLEAIFHSSIIIPTLTYVFDVLKQEEDQDSFSAKQWFKCLKKKCKELLNIDISDVSDTSRFKDEPSLYIAQELMDTPIKDVFSNINDLLKSKDEGDAE